jgi:hypothetical protein
MGAVAPYPLPSSPKTRGHFLGFDEKRRYDEPAATLRPALGSAGGSAFICYFHAALVRICGASFRRLITKEFSRPW